MSGPPTKSFDEPLPIDSLLPEIVQVLHQTSGLVISAPPGAGKTTRVPRALLEAGYTARGDILVLEPRRLAARLAALRVASELGEGIGKTVGYTIRFERIGGPQTRIWFLTEGVLARRIVQDPLLAQVSVVLLDEFHERHLSTDLALAFLRRLQSRDRPDLKLIVMSATMDTGPISGFLGQVPIVTAEGRRFEVTIDHETRATDRPLHDKVASAVADLLRTQADGDILVFLPGAGEIRRAAEVLKASFKHAEISVLPLHGDLSSEEQAWAVQPAPRRKVILATNVAETSVTIPGIAAVVDSGLARRAGHSLWSGLPTLSLVKISKASAEQRAGRAGRTRPGRVLRLYTRIDLETRIASEPPEIKRSDLAEAVLTLAGAGIRDCGAFPWFDPPPPAALKSAEVLLLQLGALDRSGNLTSLGRGMLRFPLHPRLSRIVAAGAERGVAGESALLAALVSERDIRLNARSNFVSQVPANRGPVHASGSSDLVDMFDRFNEARNRHFDSARLLSLGLDPRAVQSVERAQRQIHGLLSQKEASRQAGPSTSAQEECLRIAILAGFPDRVARRRSPGSNEFLCAAGGTARISPASVVQNASLIVAVEATERSSAHSASGPHSTEIHIASAIEPEWLAALFPQDLRDSVELTWNESAARVEEMSRTSYGQVHLEERSQPAPPSEAASHILARAARERGIGVFKDGATIPSLLARLTLLRRALPDEKIPDAGDPDLADAITEACAGKRNFAELEQVSLGPLLLRKLSARQMELLPREAPESIAIPGRRSVKVHYEMEQSPWIESRLQDFFGMARSPAICAGRVALTVHLLAPNGRAVQVTRDLAGFWERHYPGLRRELQRKYPKHAWPERGNVPAQASSNKREMRGKK
jgi:ATP-dependent helicase HrpB